jgi:hypothetical protein
MRSIFSSLCIFCVVFVIYFPTIQKGIPGGDSGELVAEACDLGVAHPPGYPLFILLARGAIELLRPSYLGAILPESVSINFSSPAYRVNAFSAVLGAATTAFLYISTVSILNRVVGKSLYFFAIQLIAASTSICFALSPLVWMYSVGAEVFVLNNFFISLLLALFIHYSETAIESYTMAQDETSLDLKNHKTHTGILKLQRITSLASFVCGLALCNQHTSILLIAPMSVWVAWSQIQFPCFGRHYDSAFKYSLLTPYSVAIYILSFLTGLIPYAHMPIAHTFWRNRGSWGDTTTLFGFIHHFLRGDYGTLRLFARDDETAEGIVDRTLAYLQDLNNVQFPFKLSILLFCFFGCLGGIFITSSLFDSNSNLYPITEQRNEFCCKRTEKNTSTVTKTIISENLVDSSQALCHCSTVSSRTSLAVSIFFIFYFAVFHSLSNMPLSDPLLFAVHQRFWMQPNLLAFVLVADGVGFISFLIFHVIQYRLPESSIHTKRLLSISTSILALYSCYLQYERNHIKSDLSKVVVMEDYARALLSPLPRKAILITSYDMQWTSVRYIQSCEGYRRDVQVFNGPMMSYPWFSSYRRLYTNVRFPGTHLAGHLTLTHAQGAFSLADFFAVNLATDCGVRLMDTYARSPPHDAWKDSKHEIVYGNSTQPGKLSGSRKKCNHTHGGLFHAGGLVFAKDEAHTHQFDFIPHGIVNRVIFKLAKGAQNLNSWRNITSMKSATGGRPASAHVFGDEYLLTTNDVEGALAAFANASYYFKGDVNISKHDNTTWELATRIDYWQQTVSYATWLLEWALDSRFHQSMSDVNQGASSSGGGESGEGPINIGTILRSASLLENAVRAQQEHNSTVLPNTWKNLGLAYMKVVRSSDPFPRQLLGHLPRLPSIGDKSVKMDASMWKKYAAERVLETWGKFMTLPEASKDSGYASIAHVVTVLREAAKSESKTKTKVDDNNKRMEETEKYESSKRKREERHKNEQEVEEIEIKSSGRFHKKSFNDEDNDDVW